MSGSPRPARPRAAYFEECEEESQTAIPGTKHSANVTAKRKPEARKPRRDEASDSGYSSRTVTTGDSSSQGSKKQTPTKGGLLGRMTRKMTGSSGKQSPSKTAAPPPTYQHHLNASFILSASFSFLAIHLSISS